MELIAIDSLLAPISDASPCGDDARYEFSYEMMESEVKKFGSLFGETVDWNIVKTNAVEVLSHHSKDLKALCYLVRALVEEANVDGLEQGLTLLARSIESFGTGLYPSRKRGRDGAVEWLNHQIKLSQPTLEQEALSWEQLSRCNDLTEEVQRHYDNVFSDSEADFYEIRTSINALMQRAGSDVAPQTAPVAEAPAVTPVDSEPERAPETAPVKTAPVAAPTPPPVKPQRKEVDVDTDFSSPTASKRTLKKVAETMLAAEPTAPLSYRIHRHLTWMDIDELPDHQNNVTPLSLAVSSDQQSEYRDKAKQESDIDTVKRLERTLTDAPFWLTGHYMVFQMLDNLELHEAAQAVKQETQKFAKSLPGLEALSFKNSVPFADEATLGWLSTSDSMSSGQQVVMPSIVIAEDDSLSMDDVTLENLGERVAEVARRLELDSSGRGQFMLHLQMVKAYHGVGLFSLCLPYLEKVWTVREEMDLASWEPHLSLQLDSLTERTLKELYPSKEQLPAKYQEWETIYN